MWFQREWNKNEIRIAVAVTCSMSHYLYMHLWSKPLHWTKCVDSDIWTEIQPSKWINWVKFIWICWFGFVRVCRSSIRIKQIANAHFLTVLSRENKTRNLMPLMPHDAVSSSFFFVDCCRLFHYDSILWTQLAVCVCVWLQFNLKFRPRFGSYIRSPSRNSASLNESQHLKSPPFTIANCQLNVFDWHVRMIEIELFEHFTGIEVLYKVLYHSTQSNIAFPYQIYNGA